MKGLTKIGLILFFVTTLTISYLYSKPKTKTYPFSEFGYGLFEPVRAGTCEGYITSCPNDETGCTACSACCTWIMGVCLSGVGCSCAGITDPDDCNTCGSYDTATCNWVEATTSTTTSTTTTVPIWNYTSIDLFLNDTDGDYTYQNGTYANFTVVLNISAYVNLTTNISGWDDQTGLSPLVNYTLFNISSNTTFNITGYYEGNVTHNSSIETHYAKVWVTTSTTTTIPVFNYTEIDLFLNSTESNQTLTYKDVSNITATINTTGLYVELYKNNTLVNNDTDRVENITDVSWFANSTYNITASYPGDSSYNASSSTLWIFVNKASGSCSLTGITNSTYPYSVTPVCTCSGDGTSGVFRNKSTANNNTAITLGVGVYEWECNMTTGTNYTSANSFAGQKVDKGATSTNLLLNNTDGNEYYENKTYANFTTVLNASQTVNITTNMTTGWTDQSGTTPLENITQVICSANNTYVNVTGYFEGNENYTSSLETHYAICWYDHTPTYSLNSTNSTEVGEAIEFRLKWDDDLGLDGYIFSFDNCTGSLVNDTWESFGDGTSDWSNETKTVNITTGCNVRWQVYANDTSNNWNSSSIFSIKLTCNCGDVCIMELPYLSTQSWKKYCMKKDLSVTGDTGVNFTGSIVNHSILDCQGNTLTGDDTTNKYGIEIPFNSVNITVENCEITNFSWAIHAGYWSGGRPVGAIYNITIKNNTVFNNSAGVWVIDGNNITINDNDVSNNTGAIYMFNCNNSRIINNNLYDNSWTDSGDAAILIANWGFNHTIENNTITNNGYGMYVGSLHDGIIKDNRISDNSMRGIGLIGHASSSLYACENNDLIGNNITSNGVGIFITLALTNNNNITGGTIHGNTWDYKFTSSGESYFRDTNFTEERTINFTDTTSGFNYNNETTGGIWLNTSVSQANTLTRLLTSWNNTLMQWNDTGIESCGGTNSHSCLGVYETEEECNADSCCNWVGIWCFSKSCSSIDQATCNSCEGCSYSAPDGKYNISRLQTNTEYDIYNNSNNFQDLATDSSGVLPQFTIDLSGEHEIKVQQNDENPRWINQSQEHDSIIAREKNTLTACFSDNVDLNHAILSVKDRRDFENVSSSSVTGTENCSSFIWTAVGLMRDRYVYWKIYFNDSSSNENVTGNMSFFVYKRPGVITTIPPGPGPSPRPKPIITYPNVTVMPEEIRFVLENLKITDVNDTMIDFHFNLANHGNYQTPKATIEYIVTEKYFPTKYLFMIEQQFLKIPMTLFRTLQFSKPLIKNKTYELSVKVIWDNDERIWVQGIKEFVYYGPNDFMETDERYIEPPKPMTMFGILPLTVGLMWFNLRLDVLILSIIGTISVISMLKHRYFGVMMMLVWVSSIMIFYFYLWKETMQIVEIFWFKVKLGILVFSIVGTILGITTLIMFFTNRVFSFLMIIGCITLVALCWFFVWRNMDLNAYLGIYDGLRLW